MIKKNNIGKVFMILLFLGILFLSGCNLKAKGGDIYTNYHTGKEGLVLEFVPQAPPFLMYDGETFQIHATLSNKGAFTLNGSLASKIDLKYDSQQSSIIKNLENNNYLSQLEGKGYVYPDGNYDTIMLGRGTTNEIKGNFETSKTSLFAEVCYPYKTEFVKQVCVDTDIGDRGLRKQVCSAETMTFSDGQGAPVAITKIEPKMIPYGNFVEPQFTITVENVAKGIAKEWKLQSEGDLSVCSGDARLNVLTMNAKMSGEDLICEPKEIILKGGVGTATCRFDTNEITLSTSNFLTTLEIELQYTYSQMYSKPFTVQRKTDLAFIDENRNVNRCQSWQLPLNDAGDCINLCNYYVSMPGDQDSIGESEQDQTLVKTGFACVYSYDQCVEANKYISSKSKTIINDDGKEETIRYYDDYNCITRPGLCPPTTYCGAPSCAIGDNNKEPKIITEYTSNNEEKVYLQTSTPDKIMWGVLDINDQVTTEGSRVFGSLNRYPDMLRYCGTKTNNAGVPISYYKFTSDSKTCTDDGWSTTESKYGISDALCPPIFEVNVEKDSEGEYFKYVCIKAEDKLGLKKIDNLEIWTDGQNTRLK
jgi:hypothetical protein